MSIKFSELITQERLMLTDRNSLIHFYDEVTDSIDSGELAQEEPPEPSWINDFLEAVGAEPLDEEDGSGGNYRVSDWCLTQDEDLDEFLEDWVNVRKQGRVDLQT